MTEQIYSDGTLAKWYYSQTNVISDGNNEYYLRNKESVKNWDYNVLLGTNDLLDELNRLSDENEKLKKSKKGQELEIVRLHHLADAMSGVLRELGIYDVYNQEQINKVKKELEE